MKLGGVGVGVGAIFWAFIKIFKKYKNKKLMRNRRRRRRRRRRPSSRLNKTKILKNKNKNIKK